MIDIKIYVLPKCVLKSNMITRFSLNCISHYNYKEIMKRKNVISSASFNITALKIRKKTIP